MDPWRLRCPDCGEGLPAVYPLPACAACGHCVAEHDGVIRLTPTGFEEKFGGFLASYARIRLAEGRGSQTDNHYRDLPGCPADDPLAWQWKIRSRSFRVLREFLTRHLSAGDRILDLGSGNGWLCNALAELGFNPCGLDIFDDADDGLAAAEHFERRWPKLQATFDDIPLCSDQADAVVFNASLHYSENYDVTIAEALRVLEGNGLLIILDSPIYHSAASGVAMLSEQHDDFARRFGERSDALASEGFLTWDRLAGLSRDFDLEWTVLKPWYGLRWQLAPFIARLLGNREPARFAVVIGRRRSPHRPS